MDNQVMGKLKKSFIVMILLIIVFAGYVEIINRNSKNMTGRQKVLKAVYPAWMWFARITGKNSKEWHNQKDKQPPVSFYELNAKMNTGQVINFAGFRGKKVLLVNTASNCGYTNQYADLQKLYEKNQDKLVVIGFPANDFKEQEKGSDEEIARFCQLNFGISFPLAQKSTVVKSPAQNPVFQWLTDSSKNGWCNQAPEWNFSKYLVTEKGMLIDYFGPSVSPSDKELQKAL
jgi:glutathione peroxidase